jgi:hypothetical protein
MSPEPFALELFRRFLAGEQIEELAEQTGIPVERVAQRIRAADDFFDRRSGDGDATARAA